MTDEALSVLLEASIGCKVVSLFELPSDEELRNINGQLDLGMLPFVVDEADDSVL
jgi:hypothetical protein